MNQQIEKFTSRGIGLESNLVDFVTGEPQGGNCDNIAAFVTDREAGERIVAMFNGLARLDYRAYEPQWVQVKVGVAKENLLSLKKLHDYVTCHDNIIEPGMIALARHASAAYTPAREVFIPRGIGLDLIGVDFVTGESLAGKGFVPNIAAYCADGSFANIQKIFGGRAGYARGQVMIGTSETNKPALETLQDLLRQSGNLITHEMVAQARGTVGAKQRVLAAA